MISQIRTTITIETPASREQAGPSRRREDTHELIRPNLRSYPQYAASILAGNTLFRCIVKRRSMVRSWKKQKVCGQPTNANEIGSALCSPGLLRLPSQVFPAATRKASRHSSRSPARVGPHGRPINGTILEKTKSVWSADKRKRNWKCSVLTKECSHVPVYCAYHLKYFQPRLEKHPDTPPEARLELALMESRPLTMTSVATMKARNGRPLGPSAKP
jgi:hypothetical protein